MRRGSIHGMIAQQHNAYKLTALPLNENDIKKRVSTCSRCADISRFEFTAARFAAPIANAGSKARTKARPTTSRFMRAIAVFYSKPSARARSSPPFKSFEFSKFYAGSSGYSD